MQTTNNETSLYIANINFAVTQEELRTFLEGLSLGIYDVRLIIDRETNRSRGFAFAKIDDPEVVEHAITAINAKEFNGRPLVARIALPRSDAPRSNRPSPGYSEPRHERRDASSKSDRYDRHDRHERRKGGWDGNDDGDYRPGRR